MSAKKNILIGAAGFAAAMVVATPAAAQYYPQPQYGYQNQGGGVLGAIVNQVLGYGRYPYGNYGYNQYGNQSQGINQCAAVVEQRLRGGGYANYGGYRYQGYNQGYGGRVLGVTRVEGRNNGGVKVWGVASSGNTGYDGYRRNNYGTYGYSAGADLRWDCTVDRYGRVRNVDINRRAAYYRGY